MTLRKCAFVYAVAATLIYNFSSAQVYTKEVKNDDSSKVSISKTPFYKWEIGIDLLPLVDKPKDVFGYILKRNFESNHGRKALRIKFLPRFGFSSVGGSNTNSSIYLAVGYEWQRVYNRFAVLYGLEPTVRYSNNTVTGQTVLSSVKDLYVGTNGFLGGRYYVGNHLAITLESHFIYNYHKVDATNIGNAGRIAVREHLLFFNPIHALYLSYHF